MWNNINDNINWLWDEFNINDSLSSWNFWWWWWWWWTVSDIYHRLDYDIRYNQNTSKWDEKIPDNMNWILFWPYTIDDNDEITIWNNSYIYMMNIQ